jgi:quercetin dioxygenase-like cupin family protein
MNNLFETKKVFNFENDIDYAKGGVVSKQVTKSEAGNITLFSFDEGQGLTEHKAPFDAVVQILDGEVEIRIDGTPYLLKKGESIIMPANHPHALQAIKPFKMLLTMIKG